MKYIYFDVSSGFSPVMALGALLDMFKEESYVNGVLHLFASSLYTETVGRGWFEGCLAHIDLCEISQAAFESSADEYIKRTAAEFQKLSPISDLREILEVVSVCKLLKSFGIDSVCYGTNQVKADFEFSIGEAFEGNKETRISPAGYALLKLLKAGFDIPEKGEISLVGYGADSIEKNPDGILRAVMYEENRSGLFVEGRAFEALFTEETAII